MNEYVLLNGIEVDAIEINPSNHKFIGLFRYPTPPKCDSIYHCKCGKVLYTIDEVFNHYQLGHMDIPQYVDII